MMLFKITMALKIFGKYAENIFCKDEEMDRNFAAGNQSG